MTPCFPVPPTVACVCRVPCVMCRSPAAALRLCSRLRSKARPPRRAGQRCEMSLQKLLRMRAPPCLQGSRLREGALRKGMASTGSPQARRRQVPSLPPPSRDAVCGCTTC